MYATKWTGWHNENFRKWGNLSDASENGICLGLLRQLACSRWDASHDNNALLYTNATRSIDGRNPLFSIHNSVGGLLYTAFEGQLNFSPFMQSLCTYLFIFTSVFMFRHHFLFKRTETVINIGAYSITWRGGAAADGIRIGWLKNRPTDHIALWEWTNQSAATWSSSRFTRLKRSNSLNSS